MGAAQSHFLKGRENIGQRRAEQWKREGIKPPGISEMWRINLLVGCKMDIWLRENRQCKQRMADTMRVASSQRLERLQGWECLANEAKFASTSLLTTPPLTTLQAAPTTCSHFLETKAAADRLHPRPNKGPPEGETNVVAALV